MRGRTLWSALYPVALGVFWLACGAIPVQARTTNFVITTTTSPAFGGQSFGSVGQYEQLDGTASGEVDPWDPQNAVIQDIELAPRNSRGMVEYSMDFSILKPIDTTRGNHTILYDVVNRGNKSSPALNIGGSATAAGDGFLESEGYTLAWSGWEGDITTGIKITLPVAKNGDGSTVTGRVRAGYILTTPEHCQRDRCAPLRSGQHQQCGRYTDRAGSSGRSQGTHRQYRLGLRRLLHNTLPRNPEYDQSLSDGRL